MSTLKIISIAYAREFEAINVQGVFDTADPGDKGGAKGSCMLPV